MITTAQIRALETAAAEAGDLRQAAICQIAIDGEISERTRDAMDADDIAAIAQFSSRDAARAECERVA